MGVVYDPVKKDDRLEKLTNQLKEMQTQLHTLSDELKESKERNKRVEGLLEERNIETSDLRSKLGDVQRLYREKEIEVSNLSNQLSSTSRSEPSFGGYIDVHCPGCGGSHSIPNRPGRYRMCQDSEIDAPFYAEVYSNGHVKVYSALFFKE
jgi:DNA repair exonuclease SbcCD ATPase subunit